MLFENAKTSLLFMAGASIAALFSIGCSIHAQAPIREVAYDYSDYAFYDRSYAPSPNYAAAYDGYYVADPAPAKAKTVATGSCSGEDGAKADLPGRQYRPAHADVTNDPRTRTRRPRVRVEPTAGNRIDGDDGATAPAKVGGLKVKPAVFAGDQARANHGVVRY